MGQTKSREEVEAENEKKEFQYKMSALFNEKTSESLEMDENALVNIFGDKKVFNEGIFLNNI